MNSQAKTLATRSMICEIYYPGTDAMTEFEVELRLDDQELVISYEDEDSQGKPLIVIYRGRNSGDGHFELRADGVEGRATLHKHPKHEVFEGTWIEEGAKGMWRLRPNL